MNTTLTDTLDGAIEHARAKVDIRDSASFRQGELFGALEVASYLRGYLNGRPDPTPDEFRGAVAAALDLVTR